jgi:hypothetical protein
MENLHLSLVLTVFSVHHISSGFFVVNCGPDTTRLGPIPRRRQPYMDISILWSQFTVSSLVHHWHV